MNIQSTISIQLPFPIDASLCNYILSGATVTIQNVSEYLNRVPKALRKLNTPILWLEPAGNYPIQTFVDSTTIISSLKHFKGNLLDSSFLTITPEDYINYSELSSLIESNLETFKTTLALEEVNNTSDVDKPVSTLQAAAIATKVGLTGNETLAGIKTFSSSPIIPTPTTDTQASTKKYVDDSNLLKIDKTSIIDNLTTGGTTNVLSAQQGVTIKTQLDSVASGSPAGSYIDLATLVSADPDHTKIYVTINDGKWNYWNGSTFVAGGDYQTPLAVVQTLDGGSTTSVPSEKAVGDKIVQIESYLSDTARINWLAFGLAPDGTINTDAEAKHTAFIPAIAGDVITSTKDMHTIALYTASKVFIARPVIDAKTYTITEATAGLIMIEIVASDQSGNNVYKNEVVVNIAKLRVEETEYSITAINADIDTINETLLLKANTEDVNAAINERSIGLSLYGLSPTGGINTDSLARHTAYLPAVNTDVITSNVEMHTIAIYTAAKAFISRPVIDLLTYTIAEATAGFVRIEVVSSLADQAWIYVNGVSVNLSRYEIDEVQAATEDVNSDISDVNEALLLKADSEDVYAKTEVHTKEEAEALFANKTSTNEVIAVQQTSIDNIEVSVGIINSNVDLINASLSELTADPPTGGTVTGNNVWTGANSFVQPVGGVAAIYDTHLIRQGEYKKTLNRYVNAADYGFLPSATASQNVTALNSALAGGNKTVVISTPGIYEVNDSILLYSNTELICGKGVIFKKMAGYLTVRNVGAATRSLNENITIRGMQIDCNEQGSPVQPYESPMAGLYGVITFYHVNNVQIYDTNIYNTDPAGGCAGIQLCAFYNCIIDGFYIDVVGGAIQVNRGEKLVCRNGVTNSTDDSLSLNAYDWITGAPEFGDIHDVLFENIKELKRAGGFGSTSRNLVGAWGDWVSGMNIHRGDSVVSNGRVYVACFDPGDGTEYTSLTEPTALDGLQADSGGFNWRVSRLDTAYSANVWDVKYKNLQLHQEFTMVILQEIGDDNDTHARSVHPLIPPEDYPFIRNVVLEDIYVADPVRTLLHCPFPYVEFQYIVNRVQCKGTFLFHNQESVNVESQVLFSGCDMRNPSGFNITYARVPVTITDCLYDTVIVTPWNARMNSNCNLSVLPDSAVKGDMVKYTDVPYYYNGTAWVSLV